MHLIRFPNNKEVKRALAAFLVLPPRLESLHLPDRQMVVLDDHIRVLEKANVRFTYLSKTATNGKLKTTVQS
jgi:hypothetical protein